MKKKVSTKVLSVFLAAALVVPLIGSAPADVSAKASVKLSAKKVAVDVGKTKKIKVKTSGVKKVVKVTCKSSKKSIAKVEKVTKKAITVSGKKAGAATLKVKVKYKAKAKGKTLSKKLSVKVTVNSASAADDKKSDVATDSALTVATNKPNGTSTATEAPTATPSPTPKRIYIFDPNATPGPTRTPGPQNLLAAFSEYTEHVGTCISWSGGGGGWGWGGWGGQQTNSSIIDANTTACIKENYNSLTAENNNKPNAILGSWNADLISVDQAKTEGILIPEGYTEANVPRLNYTNIDQLMKYCAENGIHMRYHGLLWHEQTSNWWFRQSYNSGQAYVSPAIMDKRIEYFIMNVIEHISTSEYKNVVYAYDVVNEFYHMEECIYRINEGKRDKGSDVRCYYEVYGQDIFTNPADPAHSHVVDKPAYVKKAFKCAHDMLKKHNLLDDVELVYNDYDTNKEDVRRSILAVTSYINEKDEINPDGEKLVTTIGMQCHDKLADEFFVYGKTDAEKKNSHEVSMTEFAKTGLRLQVTELDLERNGQSEADQIQYWQDFAKLVITLSKKGAHFTSLTWWGITDSSSWLGSGNSPLLFGNSVTDKKNAYYKIIEAAYQS